MAVAVNPRGEKQFAGLVIGGALGLAVMVFGPATGAGLNPVGAMFHDIGLVEGHRSAQDRFEVDGANAARDFLVSYGFTGDAVRIVWDAIALHTTPGIPQHKEPEVALVTAGVELDVLGFGYDDISAEDRDAVLAAYPRLDFKESIIEAFADGMAHRPETAFGTVNADVLAEKLSGYERPNFCALIRASKHTN